MLVCIIMKYYYVYKIIHHLKLNLSYVFILRKPVQFYAAWGKLFLMTFFFVCPEHFQSINAEAIPSNFLRLEIPHRTAARETDLGLPWNPSDITIVYSTEGFKVSPQSYPYYTESSKLLGQLMYVFLTSN